MEIAALLDALASQGVTALVKADAERMAEGTEPWTFVASGEGLRGELVRVDAASLDACLDYALPRLRSLGLSLPA